MSFCTISCKQKDDNCHTTHIQESAFGEQKAYIEHEHNKCTITNIRDFTPEFGVQFLEAIGNTRKIQILHSFGCLKTRYFMGRR